MKVFRQFVRDFEPKVSGQPRNFLFGFNLLVSLVAQLLFGVSCQTTFMTNYKLGPISILFLFCCMIDYL